MQTHARKKKIAKIGRISKESVSWKGRGGVTPSVRPTRLRLDYIHMTTSKEKYGSQEMGNLYV